MPDATLVRVLDALWPPGLPARQAVFAIVDGACDERIYAAVKGTFLPKDCLYSGDLPWQLQLTAPYLVQLERDDRFTRYLINTGWDNSWATFLRLIFRYYDPRVLRVYLPTCWPAELDKFFGPINAFIAGGEDPGEILEFRNERGTLATAVRSA